jgi:hypothetical protein
MILQIKMRRNRFGGGEWKGSRSIKAALKYRTIHCELVF